MANPKHRYVVSMAVLFVSVLGTSLNAQPIGGDYSQTQLIARFKSLQPATIEAGSAGSRSLGNHQVDSLDQLYGLRSLKYIGPHQSDCETYQRLFTLEFSHPIEIAAVIRDYMSTGAFVYVEPDYIGHAAGKRGEVPFGVTPNDNLFKRQWALHNDGSFSSVVTAVAGADIDMPDAWTITTGDSSIVVGFIDSGCKLDHPEFAGRIWHNKNEIAGNKKDDDKNGFIDDVVGWNFAYNNNNPTDDFGHGTNVAGIVGANGNNGMLYAGVDWKCKLMICKGLDSTNSGQYSWWAAALHYAVDNGARIVNMSLEGQSPSTALQDAVNYAYSKGVLVVAAMGNYNSGSPSYPAACTHAFAVGSTDPNDNRSSPFFWSTTSGSDWGPDIQVVAPGNFIFGLDHISNTNGDVYWGGTSQATPHVVGLAALLLAQQPNRTPANLAAIIDGSAIDQVGDPNEDTPGWDEYYGFGRINAYKALTLGKSGVSPRSQVTAIALYPNPANSFVSVVSDSKTPFEITVVDAIGRKRISRKLLSSERLDLTPLGTGLYEVRIVEQGETHFTKLVISR